MVACHMASRFHISRHYAVRNFMTLFTTYFTLNLPGKAIRQPIFSAAPCALLAALSLRLISLRASGYIESAIMSISPTARFDQREASAALPAPKKCATCRATRSCRRADEEVDAIPLEQQQSQNRRTISFIFARTHGDEAGPLGEEPRQQKAETLTPASPLRPRERYRFSQGADDDYVPPPLLAPVAIARLDKAGTITAPLPHTSATGNHS